LRKQSGDLWGQGFPLSSTLFFCIHRKYAR